MKATLVLFFVLSATTAFAHDSLVPHQHPHPISMLPDVGTFGVAALLLALAVIVYAQFSNR